MQCRFRILLVCVWLAIAFSAQAGPLKFELVAASGETYAHPHDIVLHPDGGLLFVADNGNHRIAVLDAMSLRELGSFADGEVSEPHDLAFDQHGRLLVADTGNSRIAVFEVDGSGGTLVGSLQGGVSRPEGVTVTPDGHVLATGAQSNNVVMYSDGEIVAEAIGFASPHDVEVDGQGGIWIADAGNDRMVRLSDKLEVTRILSGDKYGFNGPRYVDFDSRGYMYIADKYNNNIKIVDSSGELKQVLGQRKSGKGEQLFYHPEGVEIRGNDVWLSDTYNNRIVLYRITD